jgi:hypothetical protein
MLLCGERGHSSPAVHRFLIPAREANVEADVDLNNLPGARREQPTL